MYGNCDALKSPCMATDRNRPLSPTFFDESKKCPKYDKTAGLKKGFEKMAQQSVGPIIWMLRIVTVGTFFLLFKTFAELELRKEQLSHLQNDFDGLTEDLIGTERKLNASHKNLFELKMKLNAIKLQQGSRVERDHLIFDSELSVDERSTLSDSIISRQEALTTRILNLQKAIGDLHRKTVLERSVFHFLSS